MKNLHRGEKGFTLIELLVVIAILGILAAVVIPAVTQFIGSGEEESAQTELANVELAVAAMMAAPDTPIRDLSGDARIDWANSSDCTVGAAVFGDCTQTVDSLIALSGSPGTAQPLSDFTNANTFNNWYCVFADGKVAGFTDIDPHDNIRDLL